MTEAMIKDLCRQAGIQFATRTYGDVTTKPVTFDAIVDVVRAAIKLEAEGKKDATKATD